MEEQEAQRSAQTEMAGWSSAGSLAQDEWRFSTLKSGQLESYCESPIEAPRHYEHMESQQWQCLVICRRPSD